MFPKRERSVVGTTNRDVELLRQSSRFLGQSGTAFDSAYLTELTGLMKKDPSLPPSPRTQVVISDSDRTATALELLSGKKQRAAPSRLQDDVRILQSPRQSPRRTGIDDSASQQQMPQKTVVITPRRRDGDGSSSDPTNSQIPSPRDAKERILRNAFYPGVAVANECPVIAPHDVLHPPLPRNTRSGYATFPDTKHLVQAQEGTAQFPDAAARYNRDITGQIRHETLLTQSVREVAAKNAAIMKNRCETNILEADRANEVKAAARLETKAMLLQDYQSRQLLHKYPK